MARYVPIDGEMVSVAWKRVLDDMRAEGVSSIVLEGHRTFARQWYFWRCYQCRCCNGGNLAAYPSSSAPHIRTGRADHAIDFTTPDAAVSWLARNGLRPKRIVPGENWHVDVDASSLQNYNPKRKDPVETLPKHMELAVRKLQYHRKQVMQEAVTGKGKRYRRALKWRRFWRRRVENMHARSGNPKRKKILREVLDGR